MSAPAVDGEHANSIETGAAEYSKPTTRGDCKEVWDAFDRRQSARAGIPANEDRGGPDMFAQAGVAAE